MSFDSINQYQQAVGDLAVNNYHPPIMVYVWRIGQAFIGPGSMLVFHQLLYWSGIFLIAVCVSDRLWARILIIVLMGLLPPLWIHSATVWNDVGVTSSFLLAAGCILVLVKTGWTWPMYFAALALTYGLLAKLHALFAAIPMFICLSDAFFSAGGLRDKQLRQDWRRIVTLGMCMFASAFLAELLVNNLDVERITKWTTVAVWDMAAVSLAEDKLLVPRSAMDFPDEAESESLAHLQETFEPYRNGTLVRSVSLLPTRGNAKELFNAWLSLPVHHTGNYLEHRARVFLGLMGTPYNVMNLPYQDQIYPNSYGLALIHKDSWLFQNSFKLVRNSVRTILYKPWFYLTLLLIAMLISLTKPGKLRTFDGRFTVYMGTSGLLYVLPLFILAPATDFRYNLWMVACSTLLLCNTVFRRS